MHHILTLSSLLIHVTAGAQPSRPHVEPKPFDLIPCTILLTAPAPGQFLAISTFGHARPAEFDAPEWRVPDGATASADKALDILLAAPDVRVTHFGRRIVGVPAVARFVREVLGESVRMSRRLADEVPERFWTTERVLDIAIGRGHARELEERVYRAARAPDAPPISEARFWAVAHDVIPNIQFRMELFARLATDRALRTEFLDTHWRRKRDFHRALERWLDPAGAHDREGPSLFGVTTVDQLQKWLSPLPAFADATLMKVIYWDVKMVVLKDPKIGEPGARPFDVRTFARRNADGKIEELIIRGRVLDPAR